MPYFAYLIHRTDRGSDTDPDRTLSRGTRTTDASPAGLADELLAQNRVDHSYYTGPRRCWVWPDTGSVGLPRTAPDSATAYDG